MIIYPTIELSKGKCVTLTKGRLEEPVLWHVDPIKVAKGFASDGAEWMHITDFDALDGGSDNVELIQEIIRVVHIPVQLSGGFRSREAVDRWIDFGAGRIVIGTMAAYEPDVLRDLATEYPDQIVLSVDVYQGAVMTNGWTVKTAFEPEAYLRAFEDMPLAGVIITDIDMDIEYRDGSLGVISGLAAQTRHPVIASGTVRGLDDISLLKYVPNISGAIVSRALFSKDLLLGDALAVAQPMPEPIAKFQ